MVIASLDIRMEVLYDVIFNRELNWLWVKSYQDKFGLFIFLNKIS